MPAVPKKAEAKPLTIAQIRTLKALADGSALRRGKLDEAGAAAALNELLALRLARVDVLEVDGVTERTWQITEAGRQALGGAAGAGRSAKDDDLRIQGLAPWFGSARTYAAAVGEALRGCAWVGVPFCGGLSEIPAIMAAGCNAMALNDKHRYLVNLAKVAADPVLGSQLYRRLRRQPFSAEVLKLAQARCNAGLKDSCLDLDGAVNYFIAAWMARSSSAGQRKEFTAALAIRWGAGGGNSCLRFANAVWSLRAWRRILARCSMTSDDCFAFLGRCNDRDDGGIYCDPPWPGPGEAYLHTFGEAEHAKLADTLVRFKRARVVVRSGDDPLTRKLYPRSAWDWRCIAGRDQANQDKTEWLIVRNDRRQA